MRSKDPPRLREAEGAPRLLCMALESRADEPSLSDLEGLAASLGIGAAPVISAPRPGLWAVLKSKVVTAIIAPALVGGAAATVVIKIADSRREPSRWTSPTVSTTEVPALRTTTPRTLPSTSAVPTSNSPPRTPLASKDRVQPKHPEESDDDRQQPAPPPAPAPPDGAPESEVALLDRAKTLADSNPVAALRLVNEHAARFPNGMLGQEAEVIAIESLLRAGNRAAAVKRLDRFRRRFTNSAYLPHLESAVLHAN